MNDFSLDNIIEKGEVLDFEFILNSLNLDIDSIINIAMKTIEFNQIDMFKICYRFAANCDGDMDVYKFIRKTLEPSALYGHINFCEYILEDENLNIQYINFIRPLSYCDRYEQLVHLLLPKIIEQNKDTVNIIYSCIFGLIIKLKHFDYKDTSRKSLHLIKEYFDFSPLKFLDFLNDNELRLKNSQTNKIENLLDFLLEYSDDNTFLKESELFLDFFTQEDLNKYNSMLIKNKVKEF